MMDRQQTVANLVLEHSECAEVFQRHRIDFCCRGDTSIEAAAREKQVDVEALMTELSRAIAERGDGHIEDPRALSTPRLVAHIVSKYHEALRKALPTIRGLATKVAGVHGARNPKLGELEAAVEALAAAILPHLEEEETELFPALVSRTSDPRAVNALLGTMMEDHLAVAALLERIRAASDEFALPEWACRSYRALFSELQQLERDLFAHIHLENHVLRPRFVAA